MTNRLTGHSARPGTVLKTAPPPLCLTRPPFMRPPDQDEEVDEVIYRQLEVASRSQAPVLMGDFNHPICWKGNTTKYAQSRRFLQSIDDNFLTQVVEEPTQRGVLLDLVLTKED
ncbi:hypothetical protein GRJ2_003085200 [Grus japonensis]|uniref:Endonuclease/exonuclease/phosphatase domain-containing protein n=1 Tax=Grus japonensis TaxID=30415 RepID=A0ABC9Y8T9_GRUJA